MPNVSGDFNSSSSKQSVHVPVLLNEVVDGLLSSSQKSKIADCDLKYLDGTLGGAGHALAISEAFKISHGNNARLTIIGLDQDPQAVKRAKETLGTLEKGASGDRKVILECANFRNLDKALDKHGIKQVDIILLDLGISSDELDNSGRGFTFQKDEPLLMTMGDQKQYPFTAETIVNEWKEEDIANVIFGYGEDRYSRRIAKAIVNYRDKKTIETTIELAEIVKMAVPIMARGMWNGKKSIHPATKTFQALRIAVNDELNALKEGLVKGFERLAPGGRMAVISFHSLEDRIVKIFFREIVDKGSNKNTPKLAVVLTKKPITASPQEIAENSRSRSAKLRILEKGNNLTK